MKKKIDEITHIGGRKRPIHPTLGPYSPVVLETYFETKNGHDIHARPVKGQAKFPSDLDAECCKYMRKEHPIGTMFLVWGIITDKEGTDFVYTSWQWKYELVDSQM